MKIARIAGFLAIIIGVASAAVLPVAAATYGGGSVQAYSADAPIDAGSVVQLTGKDSNRVKLATKADLQNMFGVAVDRSELLVSSVEDGLQNATFVTASGTYKTLVSTEGGSIAAGDYLTMSSVNGVAMKAGLKESTVLGRAVNSFDGTGVTLGVTELKDTEGNVTQTVKLGAIPATIDIKHNPNDESTKANLPDFLQRIGKAIAEKEVSPIRIYLSMAIVAVSIITAIVILYAGVRNGFVSIGRNPMTKKAIFRALLEVILTSILILIIGLFAVYLLLRL